MKKFLLILFVMANFLSISAQEKIGEYKLSYFPKDTFDIYADVSNDGDFTYFIFGESKEPGKKVGFILEKKDINSFITELRSIEDKFEEWSNTAKTNSVTNYSKNFDTKFKKVGVFFIFGAEWHFNFTKFKPYFKVTDQGICLAVFNVDEITDYSNRFIHHNGFMIAFQNKKEIEDFINVLDPEKLLKKAAEQKADQSAKDALFK